MVACCSVLQSCRSSCSHRTNGSCVTGGLGSGVLAARHVPGLLHRLAPQGQPAPGGPPAGPSLLQHSSASLPAAEALQEGSAGGASQAAYRLRVPQLQVSPAHWSCHCCTCTARDVHKQLQAAMVGSQKSHLPCVPTLISLAYVISAQTPGL